MRLNNLKVYEEMHVHNFILKCIQNALAYACKMHFHTKMHSERKKIPIK